MQPFIAALQSFINEPNLTSWLDMVEVWRHESLQSKNKDCPIKFEIVGMNTLMCGDCPFLNAHPCPWIVSNLDSPKGKEHFKEIQSILLVDSIILLSKLQAMENINVKKRD